MTWGEWGLIAAVFALNASMWGALYLYRKFAREIERHLDETRRCNDEFAEAIALARYGATDEAIALARRWRERVRT